MDARPGEAEVIARILSLRAVGAAMDTIAETLNVEGCHASQWNQVVWVERPQCTGTLRRISADGQDGP
jgi:hypothetical protein